MHEITAHLFNLPIPLLEKIIRPILIYAFLVVLLRVFGKRELAQLNPFDLVVLLSLSNTVQNAIIGEDNSVTGGLIGAATLLTLNHFVVKYLYSHERLNQLIEGDSCVLIEAGELKMDTLKQELLTVAELEVAAHKQGFGSLDEIERAVLDAEGSIAFFGKRPTPDISRHEEILARLDAMTAQLSSLRASRG
jgi:uncharacterized membrane protein YcaP (DUF421 family)